MLSGNYPVWANVGRRIVCAVLGRLRASALSRVQRAALLAVAAEQHRGVPLDLAGTVEVETTFARLLLDEHDEWITPTLQATQGWEPGQTALLGERITPAMTVVDAGAHVGYFTCQAARLVGPRGLVLAFEPAPRNYELLTANVWRNGFTNVVCFRGRSARQRGSLRFSCRRPTPATTASTGAQARP